MLMVRLPMPMMPMALMMAIELAVYGMLIGCVIMLLKKSQLSTIFVIMIALVISMIGGRIAFALSALFFMESAAFFPVFFSTFTGSFIGIILQLILIPIIALRLKKYGYLD